MWNLISLNWPSLNLPHWRLHATSHRFARRFMIKENVQLSYHARWGLDIQLNCLVQVWWPCQQCIIWLAGGGDGGQRLTQQSTRSSPTSSSMCSNTILNFPITTIFILMMDISTFSIWPLGFHQLPSRCMILSSPPQSSPPVALAPFFLHTSLPPSAVQNMIQVEISQQATFHKDPHFLICEVECHLSAFRWALAQLSGDSAQFWGGWAQVSEWWWA